MTSRVLVATDLSDAAAEAIRQADAYARAEGGELGICHVVPQLQGVHMLFPQLYAREAVEGVAFEKVAGDAVAATVAEHTGRAEGQYEVMFGEGTDYAEIVRCAEDWRATLLVLGSHGASAESASLGSVAAKVVRYAPCSVLIARTPAKQEAVVMVATDLSDPSLPALQRAADEARRRSAKLVAVTAIELGGSLGAALAPFGAPPVAPPPEALDDLCAAARSTLAASLERYGVAGETFVEAGHPEDVVLRALEKYSPQLLVVATHGRTGLKRVALGSVAETLVRAATTSVLVVR